MSGVFGVNVGLAILGLGHLAPATVTARRTHTHAHTSMENMSARKLYRHFTELMILQANAARAVGLLGQVVGGDLAKNSKYKISRTYHPAEGGGGRKKRAIGFSYVGMSLRFPVNKNKKAALASFFFLEWGAKNTEEAL